MGWEYELPQKHHSQDQAFKGAGRWVEWIPQLRKCKAEIKRFTPENGRLEKEFPTGKHHF